MPEKARVSGNPWIRHVQAFADANNMTYSSALKNRLKTLRATYTKPLTNKEMDDIASAMTSSAYRNEKYWEPRLEFELGPAPLKGRAKAAATIARKKRLAEEKSERGKALAQSNIGKKKTPFPASKNRDKKD
jgi:hypothetical protein